MDLTPRSAYGSGNGKPGNRAIQLGLSRWAQAGQGGLPMDYAGFPGLTFHKAFEGNSMHTFAVPLVGPAIGR